MTAISLRCPRMGLVRAAGEVHQCHGEQEEIPFVAGSNCSPHSYGVSQTPTGVIAAPCVTPWWGLTTAAQSITSVKRNRLKQVVTHFDGLGNREPRSCEILMFACLQKGAKQCDDVTKLECTYCAGHRHHKARLFSLCQLISTMSNEYSRAMWYHTIVWHLFRYKQTSKFSEA